MRMFDKLWKKKRNNYLLMTWVSSIDLETALLTEKIEKDYMLLFKREFILTATTLRLIISWEGNTIRNIGLANVQGLSMSVYEDVTEMVIHCATDGDEHFYSRK